MDRFTGTKEQVTSTVLPQRFKDSSHLFGQALAEDLRDLSPEESSQVIHYVDDLLICSSTKELGCKHVIEMAQLNAQVAASLFTI